MMFFRRSLQKRIRQRIRKEQRRRTKVWRSILRFAKRLRQFGAGCFLIVILTLVAARFLTVADKTEVVLVFATLFTVLAVMGRTRGLQSEFRYSDEVLRSSLLPVSDSYVFRRIWRRSLLSSGFTLYLLFALYASLACFGQFDRVVWLQIAAAAIAQWLAVLSLSTCCLAYWPSRRVDLRLSLPFVVLLAAFLFSADFVAANVQSVAAWILLAIPTGWPAGAFHSVIADSPIPTWGFVMGAVALLLPLPFAYRRLKRSYCVREFEFHGVYGTGAVLDWHAAKRSPQPTGQPTPSRARPSSSGSSRGPKRPPRPFVPRPTERDWTVRSVLDLMWTGLPWQQSGWIERVVARCLTPRERSIAEILTGGSWSCPLHWTRSWRRSAVLLFISLVAILALPLSQDWTWIVFLLIGGCALAGAPVFGGDWPRLPLETSDVSNTYRILPISYRETSRVILTVNGLRCLAWLPLAVLGGAFGAWKNGMSPYWGAILAVKLTYVVVVLQTIPIVLRFDQGTRHPWRPKQEAIALAAALLILAIMIAGLFLLFATSPWLTAAGAVVVAVSSYLEWLIYERWYEYGPVDVLPKPTVQQYQWSEAAGSCWEDGE